MHSYLITIPDVDLVDEPIVARSASKAIVKALARGLDNVDFDSSLEVIVAMPSGRKAVYDAKPVLSFRTKKGGLRMGAIRIVEPGVHPVLSNALYHLSNGVSKTGVCRVARAPLVFRDALDNPGRSKKNRSLVTGSVFHVVMEGAFERDCAVGPQVDNKNKKEWTSFVEENSGKICVTPDEAIEVFRMRESLLRYGPAAEILAQPGRFECSYYWIDPVTGLLCKCRPDWISTDQLTIIDFKTCQDATEAAFVRAAERYHYHVSAAMTLDGVEAVTGIRPDRYIFLAIEPQSPYLTAAYEATADDVDRGRAFYRRSLSTLKRCIENGAWPGLPEEIRALDVARWRGRWHEDEEEIDELETHTESGKEWWNKWASW